MERARREATEEETRAILLPVEARLAAIEAKLGGWHAAPGRTSPG